MDLPFQRFCRCSKSAHDVAAGVNFARSHALRVVIKGDGHNFEGTSNAADSLFDLDA